MRLFQRPAVSKGLGQAALPPALLLLLAAGPHGATARLPPRGPGAVARWAALEVSADGTCGGGVSCLGSAWGDCCSGHGFCGRSTDHCGAGCDAAFGSCGGGGGAPAAGGGPGPAASGACEVATQRVTETWWRKATGYTTTVLATATITATTTATARAAGSTTVRTVTATVTAAVAAPEPVMPKTRRNCGWYPPGRRWRSRRCCPAY